MSLIKIITVIKIHLDPCLKPNTPPYMQAHSSCKLNGHAGNPRPQSPSKFLLSICVPPDTDKENRNQSILLCYKQRAISLFKQVHVSQVGQMVHLPFVLSKLIKQDDISLVPRDVPNYMATSEKKWHWLLGFSQSPAGHQISEMLRWSSLLKSISTRWWGTNSVWGVSASVGTSCKNHLWGSSWVSILIRTADR